ncbi:MAG TPA: D-alanyl-D-alanine carboxypeptidase family protein [Hyphomicrobium sp.]
MASALAWALAWTMGTLPAAAGAALLFDMTDGHVLYAEDPDAPWYPASLTKMMTAYLAFEAIRDDKVTEHTRIFISPNARKQPPTRLGLAVGKDLPLSDALRALIMRSANDIAVAIAETLGGDEMSFVKLMNQKAAELGMLNTHFINPHGLPAEDQVTTARDMALLSQALLRDFPEHAPLYAMTQTKVLNDKITIGTHNALLTNFPGGDGIKTGFTCASGYNLAASATRDGRRMIAIVLGAPSSAKRNARAAALLENGFRTYEWKALAPTPRVENLPSEMVGAGFEPDATMLERYRVCKAPPPPPKDTASTDAKTKKSAKKKVVRKRKRRARK